MHYRVIDKTLMIEREREREREMYIRCRRR